MPLAAGVNKQVRIKEESVFGTAPGATGAQLLRRVDSSVNTVKDTYESAEIVSDYQVTDYRHGSIRVEGTLNGELSPGTYQMLMAAALRRDFAAGATSGALTIVTAAAGPPGTFTRSSGSWLTDGFRVGQIVRWTGWASPATANNARNYRIIALTATVMTVVGTGDETVVAKAAGDSVTCTVVGKTTFTPSSGHTNKSFAIEEWFSDVSQSELSLGCRVQSMQIQLPAQGMARVSFGVLGQKQTMASSAYYTSPTPAPSTGLAVAVSGTLRVAGADVAILTGLEMAYNGGMTTLPVVGSPYTPDVFPGRVRVTGQATAAFLDPTLRDLFLNETEADIWAYLRLSSAVNSDFLSFYLARVKMGGAAKSDGEQSIIQTLPFQALRKASGTDTELTTLLIQDSTL